MLLVVLILALLGYGPMLLAFFHAHVILSILLLIFLA